MPNPQQQELNKKLTDAAESGNLADIRDLIGKGADVNGRHCLDGCRHTPLMKAAATGNLAAVTLLLENGADTTLRDSEQKTAEEMAVQGKKMDVVARLRLFEEQANIERVIFNSQVGDRTRQDIFDFTVKERVTLIRQDKYGSVETSIITGFSAIEDQSDGSMLRKAFNEHVKRGGQTPESDVFSTRIFKPKPGLQKPD